MKVYRAAARVSYREDISQVSDQMVLARLRRPSPVMILRAARFRLLGPLVHTGPPVVSGLVAAEWHAAADTNTQSRTILGLWYDDLGWLQQALPTL
eukprot:2238403-Pyramimonas_sp.AAC.1